MCARGAITYNSGLPSRRDVSWQKLTVQWRFDGVWPTRELLGTKKPINGQRSLQVNHTSMVWKPAMLVVPVPDPDPGTPLQGVPGVEAVAEDPVGGGEEGDREVEGPVEDQGPPGGREVQPGGTGLPILHGRGKRVTPGVRRQSGSSGSAGSGKRNRRRRWRS